MVFRFLADAVVIFHLAFVAFALFGGLLVMKWKRVAWIHIPSAAWAVIIEFTGMTCPLTPLENYFRNKGGLSGYDTGFVEHYIMPILYPESLDSSLQIILGILVIVVNAGIYAWVFRQSKQKN